MVGPHLSLRNVTAREQDYMPDYYMESLVVGAGRWPLELPDMMIELIGPRNLEVDQTKSR